jgi:hypothetical protein
MGTRDIRRATGVLVPLVLVLMLEDARASVIPVDLKDLIARSDLIVVATVTKVEDGPADMKPPKDWLPPVEVATARVVETWKGPAVREIRYVASPTWTCDTASAEEGERVVLFLKKREGSTFLAVLHSGRGRMPLRHVGKEPYVTLPDDVILPEGTPTISEKKTARVSLPSSKPGQPAPAPFTFTYSVTSIEIGTLRELVRSLVPKKSDGEGSDRKGARPQSRGRADHVSGRSSS